MATKVINLTPRSPNYIIHFPGGAVEINQTSEGDYWAHIARERQGHAAADDVGVFASLRLDSETNSGRDADEKGRALLADVPDLYHVALRIGRQS